jgi:alcohol dehydrogenase
MPRVAVFQGCGKPMTLAEFPLREPRGAEILVRITACTLCRSDLHTHAGRRNEPTPTVLGHEIVGRIEAFGPTASHHDARGDAAFVGSRVTWAIAVGCGQCFFCADDLPQKCERPHKYGHKQMTDEAPYVGGLADYAMLVPGTAWFCLPDAISDHVAAPANCATATVAALVRYAGPLEGRTVLVLGAGVLGVTACAMARAAGARTVIVGDPSADCRRRALRFGATDVFDVGPELASGLAELTSGRGTDLTLELAGVALSVEAGLKLTRIGGTLLLAGTVAPTASVALDPEQVVRRMLTIRGVHNYHPRDLAAALDFLAGSRRDYPFESLVCANYPLERIEEAFQTAHAHPGARVVVTPNTVCETRP